MRSKDFIVDVIINAPSSAPVVRAAKSRFGDQAYEDDFKDVPEATMNIWYDEYLDDQHDADVRENERIERMMGRHTP